MKFYHSVIIELYILLYYTTCKDAFANNSRLRTLEAYEGQFCLNTSKVTSAQCWKLPSLADLLVTSCRNMPTIYIRLLSPS